MARPCKPIETQSRHNTKEEIEARKKQEEKLKGLADKIKPPKYLNKDQKKIFKYIVDELKASGILSNLDIYVLATCSIAISRLTEIEKQINKDITNLWDKTLMSSKDKYTKDFFRCCNELSLSPQARAKIGSLALQAKEKEEDPLIKALRDDDDG
ncbi:phage terminase small subunit P27 family [Clostridium tertium]|uniref:phage terminase small subunit P27 family n=1 Tax=Clostridium tertium TaxID=1559 RepID=UPI0011591DA9|nr:phage terminase small subunit P27 family [Clostridium tertium]MDB1935129.1 phage terminase small subunit P27 family [Clostridium tertium]MDB1938416.1 phage terminase small subunit P27 family [Clostridium tertium]MDB1956034.1 phage terminase small subunit P27 family [Clostridium tertium]MDB1959029.1 phage terminase small subunit P27 family [Clostridium tertium]MDB1962106.1 phage terminase small subunit P27 family [Clostridium tertium]